MITHPYKRAVLSLFGIALAATLCVSCGRQDIPVEQTTTTQPPASDTKYLEEAQSTLDYFDAREEARASELFKIYEIRIKNSEFAGAQSAINEIKDIYNQDSAYRSFWEKKIPWEKRTRLSLLAVCSACKGGDCLLCEGSGKCNICAGTGVCQHCNGDSVRKQTCWNCICKTCGGNGICRTCSGYGQVKCESCGGIGSIEKRVDVPCPRCGGTGSIEGLKGTLGPNTLRCLTCGGKGKIPKTLMDPCLVCKGRAKVICPSCNQSTQCKTCSGTGRMLSCAVCSGKGFTLHSCPVCQGTAKCNVCTGTGLCPKCKGSVRCPACKGGLIPVYEFSVSSDWMTMANGFAFYDQQEGKTTLSDPFPGHKTIKYKDHVISFNVEQNHVVWISSSGSFDSTRQLFKR